MLFLLFACTADCPEGQRLEKDACVDVETGSPETGSPDTDDTAGVDGDGDGWSVADGDCNDDDDSVFPGAVEACNGVDDDCVDGVPAAELRDEDSDGNPACLDCDDLDAEIRDSDGSCDEYVFPLGYMSVEDPAEFAELAALGINRVHAYNFGPWPGSSIDDAVSWSTTYLDEASSHGLTVLANLNGRTWAERGAPIADFEAFLGGVDGHAALDGWYLADEPEVFINQDSLQPYHDAIRDSSPDIPIHIAHCFCTDWWGFWDTADVRMPDYYGVANETAPSIWAYYHPLFASYHRTYYTESRIEPIQQGFNYAVYSDSDPENYPADSRFPTRDELRFGAFSDLTLGVNGLWWWSWTRANEHEDGPAWIADTLSPVLTEITAFTELTLPARHPVSVNPGPYDDIEYTYLAYWPRPEAVYVVATNGSAASRTLEITLGSEFADAELTGWDTSSAVVLDASGATEVEAEPYEVFIWVAEQF